MSEYDYVRLIIFIHKSKWQKRYVYETTIWVNKCPKSMTIIKRYDDCYTKVYISYSKKTLGGAGMPHGLNKIHVTTTIYFIATGPHNSKKKLYKKTGRLYANYFTFACMT